MFLSQSDIERHTLAKYLMELTLMDYEMVHFPPSMVASAALALTLKILDAGEWVSLILLVNGDFMKTVSCVHQMSPIVA